jgi:hypothetical protein
VLSLVDLLVQQLMVEQSRVSLLAYIAGAGIATGLTTGAGVATGTTTGAGVATGTTTGAGVATGTTTGAGVATGLTTGAGVGAGVGQIIHPIPLEQVSHAIILP